MKRTKDKTSVISSRNLRRVVVVATYGSYAVMVAFWSLSGTLDLRWLFYLAALCGLLTLMSYSFLTMSVYGSIVNEWREARLDERQQEVRNRAYFIAYSILAGLAMTLALYGYIAADSGSFWLPRTSNELQASFWAAWLVATTLPAAVHAWLEPDPPAEEVRKEVPTST